MVFLWLGMIASAVGNDAFLVNKDFASDLDHGKEERHPVGRNKTATTSASEFRDTSEYADGDGLGSPTRFLQEEANIRMLKILRLMPILGAMCCVCGIAGVGAKFFLGAGKATSSG
jgi:hypothetical protein